jgi:hypothetical protein
MVEARRVWAQRSVFPFTRRARNALPLDLADTLALMLLTESLARTGLIDYMYSMRARSADLTGRYADVLEAARAAMIERERRER